MANAAAVTEGDDGDATTDMTFAVTLSAAAKKQVTVPYTLGGTATSGTDYEAHGASPSLTIAVGDTSATITVAINGDVEDEGNETVTVTLGTPTNATLKAGSSTASGTITDDEAEELPEITVSDAASTLEGNTDSGGELRFPVTLTTGVDEPVVLFFSIGGSATEGIDFVAQGTSPHLEIPANTEASEIVLSLIGDAEDEGDEVVEITLNESVLSDYEIAENGGTAIGTIVNDDLPAIQLSDAKIQVAEDESFTYSVLLEKAPSESFTVTARASSDAIVFDTESVEFSPTDWRNPGSLGVTVNADADARPEKLTIEHFIEPNKFEEVYVPVLRVQVVDMDTDGVLVSKQSIEIDERSKGSYEVSLNAQPVSDVIVVPTPVSAKALSVSGALTFTSENWSQSQEVELSVLDNGAFVNNLTSITHKVYGYYYETLEHPVVAVRINNDLEPRVAIAPEFIDLKEGESASYSIVLSSAPGADVVISPISQSPSLVTVSGPLEFDDSNWYLRQNVLVTSIDDDIPRNEQVVINHDFNGPDGIERPSEVSLFVHDNDTRELLLNERFIIVDEGEGVEYEVALRSPPNEGVRVEISTSDEDLTERVAITSELEFSRETWDIPQTVRVFAHADSVDREFLRSRIEHTAYGGGYDDAPIASLDLSILDDDRRGVELSTSDLLVYEGETAEYSVRLTSEPLQIVTFTSTLTGKDELANSIKLSSPLEFNSLNWHLPKLVTVDAQSLKVEGTTEFMIEHSSQGGGYGDENHPSVNLTFIDRDGFGVIVHPNQLPIPIGEQASYEIRLTSDPNEEVVIVLEPSVTDILEFPDSIEFSSESWDRVQSVVVAVNEHVRPSELEPITLSHSVSSGAHQGIYIEPVVVTVTEGVIAGVSVNKAEISLSEGESTDISMALATAPQERVEVEPISSREGLFSFNPETIVFTSDDWKMPQRVSVRAIDNEYLGILEETITWRTTGEEHFEDIDPTVTKVVVFDNDSPSIVSDQTMLSIDEGSSESLRLNLSHPPNDDVLVQFEIDGEGITIDPSELLFTVEDWDTKKAVSVSTNDDDMVSHIVRILACVASGGGYDEANAVEMLVEVVENDRIDVEFGEARYIHEGRSLSYWVSLKSRPATDVNITPISGNDDVVVVTPGIEFQPDDWIVPKYIVLEADHDEDSQSEIVELWHEIVGGAYGALQLPPLSVDVLDDDEVGVRVKPQNITIEEGGKASYGVVLQSPPNASVVINMESSNAEALIVDESIEFSPSDWHIEQQVSVTSPANSIGEDTEVSITHSISGGGYDTIEIDDVVVQIENKEVVEALPSRLSLKRGELGAYSIKLAHEPAAVLILKPSSSGDGALDISPSSVVISPSNWDQPVKFTVALNSENTSNPEYQTIEIVHSLRSSNASEVVGFENVARVTVTNSEPPERLPIQATIVMESDGSAVVSLTLPSEPTSLVQIISNSLQKQLRFIPADVSFTSRNWSATQSMRVHGNTDRMTLSGTAIKEALGEFVVSSADRQFRGAMIEVLNISDSIQASRVVQGILKPLTGFVARSNIDRVITCIDRSLRDDFSSEQMLERNLSSGSVERWNETGVLREKLALELTPRGGNVQIPSQSRNIDGGVSLNHRTTICSGRAQSTTNIRDELTANARGSSTYFGGSTWINERYLLGFGFAHEDQFVDWHETLFDLDGEAVVHLNTVSPFVARVGEKRTNRVWGMVSVGSGFLELDSGENLSSDYDLMYQGVGVGGSWELPSRPSMRVRGQSWWAASDAANVEDRSQRVQVANRGVRINVSGDWSFQLGENVEFGTTLSSGLLNDSGIGTTAVENLLGMNVSHRVVGIHGELQMRSVDASDGSFRTDRLSATFTYRPNTCCNRSGPWFNLKIGSVGNAVFADSVKQANQQLRQIEDLLHRGDTWRLESGWNTNWRYHGITLNPAIWIASQFDMSVHDFGLSNTYDAGDGIKFKTQLLSQDRGKGKRDVGVRGKVRWVW